MPARAASTTSSSDQAMFMRCGTGPLGGFPATWPSWRTWRCRGACTAEAGRSLLPATSTAFSTAG